jgi:hypothetical protein
MERFLSGQKAQQKAGALPQAQHSAHSLFLCESLLPFLFLLGREVGVHPLQASQQQEQFKKRVCARVPFQGAHAVCQALTPQSGLAAFTMMEKHDYSLPLCNKHII